MPLLRPGFRPEGVYSVSFVYLHAGAPFLKKGDMQMTLPKMDVPVNVVEWELFVPDRFRVDRFAGNMIDVRLARALCDGTERIAVGRRRICGRRCRGGASVCRCRSPQRAQIIGRVIDEAGAPLPGVTVWSKAAGSARRATADESGIYIVVERAVRLGHGDGATARVRHAAPLAAVRPARPAGRYDPGEWAGVTETVTVDGRASVMNDASAEPHAQAIAPNGRTDEAPSVNVQNLQRRASGVLPVRMEVPRAGTSHRFVKPLVIDEETVVTFRYKRR